MDTRASRIPPRASKRGGRRPGAGAPQGNLNGLKHGRYSRRIEALRLALRAGPLTADVIRRVDAAGDGSRVLFARALHHIADLILLTPDAIQSNLPPRNGCPQLPFRVTNTKNKQTIKGRAAQ